ncbi:MAG: hypothetical protein AB8B99_04230 [Phormidesmis sp.]
MGKQKIDRLLAQLKDNHQRDIQTDAAIFAVAQGTVNELAKRAQERAIDDAEALVPLQLTKDDLIAQYGNYNACRRAAKKAGIVFSRSPRWTQLVAAFNYVDACQTCVTNYLAQNPNSALEGVRLTLTL